MTATTLKLSDLAGPDADGWSDVAVFARSDGSESEPFVVLDDRAQGYVVIESANWKQAKGGGTPVRRLGRGRLVPARIVMEGEEDLAVQVATLREALEAAKCRIENEAAEMGIDDDPTLAKIDAALAATAPTPTEDAK